MARSVTQRRRRRRDAGEPGPQKLRYGSSVIRDAEIAAREPFETRRLRSERVGVDEFFYRELRLADFFVLRA